MQNRMSSKPFQCKIQISNRDDGSTSFAGLSLVREVLRECGFIREMKMFGLKYAGYGDEICLEALILLLAAGGRSLSDWQYMMADSGFRRMFPHHLSVDTLANYLQRLDLQSLPGGPLQQGGQCGYSTILERLHERLLEKIYQQAGCPQQLTLDVDAP